MLYNIWVGDGRRYNLIFEDLYCPLLILQECIFFSYICKIYLAWTFLFKLGWSVKDLYYIFSLHPPICYITYSNNFFLWQCWNYKILNKWISKMNAVFMHLTLFEWLMSKLDSIFVIYILITLILFILSLFRMIKEYVIS